MRLIHDSVRVHLCGDTERLPGLRHLDSLFNSTDIVEAQGHYVIFVLCPCALDYGKLTGPAETRFLDYATRFWPTHSRCCQTSLSSRWEEHSGLLKPLLTCGLAKSTHITQPFRKHLEREQNGRLPRFDKIGSLPIIMAATGGRLLEKHLQHCQYDLGDSQFVSKALLRATRAGEEGIVDFLLKTFDLDINGDLGRGTALYHACYSDHKNVITTLLKNHAMPNVAIRGGYMDPRHVAEAFCRWRAIDAVLGYRNPGVGAAELLSLRSSQWEDSKRDCYRKQGIFGSRLPREMGSQSPIMVLTKGSTQSY